MNECKPLAAGGKSAAERVAFAAGSAAEVAVVRGQLASAESHLATMRDRVGWCKLKPVLEAPGVSDKQWGLGFRV
jgi:hypothetical protein